MSDLNADSFLLKFLDKKAHEAEKEMGEKGILSDEIVIPVLLKVLFSRVLRIEEELTAFRKTTEERFERLEKRMDHLEMRLDQLDTRLDQMDKRLDQLDKRLDQMDRKFGYLFSGMTLGFAVLSFLTIYIGFLK